MAVTNSSAANTEYETHGKFVTTQIFPTDDVVHRLSTIFIVYSFLYFRNFLARNEQLFLFLIGTLRNRTWLVFCHQDEKSHLPAATYSTERPVIFLDLFFEDLSKRIQYPFKEPENWKNRPLRHANWRGTSGRKNVLRKLLRIPYRRLKAGFSVCWLCLFVWSSEWNARGANVCSL